MNWDALFEMQRTLDQAIQRERGLEKENLTAKKILAFQVELGELANETRCFKFWSHKKASPDTVVLEEYVDGLHFLLSIGLETGEVFLELEPGHPAEELCAQFQEVYRCASVFQQSRNGESFRHLFSAYLTLARMLGFTEVSVMQAYEEKNRVNHRRQEEGY